MTLLRGALIIARMTTAPAPRGWVPENSFPMRLAAVRAQMKWNMTKADRECGFGDGTWRTWEVEERRPQEYMASCKRISLRTGCDPLWLMGYSDTDAQNLKIPNGKIAAVVALRAA